jgi:hypothetical protein
MFHLKSQFGAEEKDHQRETNRNPKGKDDTHLFMGRRHFSCDEKIQIKFSFLFAIPKK